jgi:hypothetical protein
MRRAIKIGKPSWSRESRYLYVNQTNLRVVLLPPFDFTVLISKSLVSLLVSYENLGEDAHGGVARSESDVSGGQIIVF